MRAVALLVRICSYVWKAILFGLFRLSPVTVSRWIGVTIGNNVHIYGNWPSMWGTEPFLIEIGDSVFITDGVTFVCHDGGTLILRPEVPDLELTAPIIVGSDVYIGVRAVILPGVRIGNRVIIGAGAVVTKDIPDNSVAVGVPARVIKTVDEYLESSKARSLHLGHLSPKKKERALRAQFRRKTSRAG